jgi:glycerol uptake facilitator-like aquaporin
MKQRHVAALVAEALGVFTLVLVVLSVSRLGYPFFTAIAAGVTITLMVSAFIKISGGHFNPAITISRLAIKDVSAIRAFGYVIAQVAAAFLAMKVYEILVDNKLVTSTGQFDWRVFLAEALGALVFGAAVAAVVTQKYEGYQAAYTVGTGLFLGLLVASLASNAVLNPAVAVGLKMADVNYIFGPIVGSLVGFGLVAFVINPIVSTVSVAPKKEVKAEEPVKTLKSSPAKKPAAKKVAKKPVAKKTTKKTVAKK